MKSGTVKPGEHVSLFVKEILYFEEQDEEKETVLPFFADGYPGLIFYEGENPLVVKPHTKHIAPFFLYGQTIHPVELVMQGKYRMIVFQLYPFVLRSLFGITPKDFNDDCYDLHQLKNDVGSETLSKLYKEDSLSKRITIIESLLLNLYAHKQHSLDEVVGKAVQLMIHHHGQIVVSKLCEDLHVTERTFERRFLAEVGVTAKQLAKMIRFQHSLEQLSGNDYTLLTDIVYAHGYADQSHFIKVFKDYTGKTPFAFKTGK